MDCWEPPSLQSSRHLNERRHSLDFNTGTLRSTDNVRGGHHREENRRKINAYTYARVESVREGRRKIDDGRRRIRTNQSGQQQTPQEMTIHDHTEKQGKAKTKGENGERRRASGLPRRSPARSSLQDPLTGPEEQSHSKILVLNFSTINYLLPNLLGYCITHKYGEPWNKHVPRCAKKIFLTNKIVRSDGLNYFEELCWVN